VKLFIQIILVSVGSALGGLARWGVSIGMAKLAGTTFHWGTLLINISGSLFLGWFSTIVGARLPEGCWIRQEDLRLLVAVGFTGAFTTFSTFEFETYSLFRDDRILAAATYMAGSVFLGLLAVWLGVRLAKLC
jgi:CrcB protein